MWQQVHQAEELTLLARGRERHRLLRRVPQQPWQAQGKPYQARMKRNGKDVYLGSFTTAKEAALCAARSYRTPEGQAVAAERTGCMQQGDRHLASRGGRHSKDVDNRLTSLGGGV